MAKTFVKCGVCEYQFDGKLVGKLQDDEAIFVCVACKIGKRLTAIEERVSKLEGNKRELDNIKDGLAEVRAAVAEIQEVSRPGQLAWSTVTRSHSRPHSVTSEEEFAECNQLLTVELPPETGMVGGKTCKGMSEPSKREDLVVIGNSLVKNVSSSRGKARIISIPGGGIADIEKEIYKELPEKLIVHIGANDVSRYMNRSEVLVGKIRKVLDELRQKRKSVIVSGNIPRPRNGSYWHSVACSLDMRIQKMCLERGFVFIDNWRDFYGKKDFYVSDGIHLNASGVSMLEYNFSEALKK